MANQASKKREKGNSSFIRYMQIALVAINAWFFVYNLVFRKGKYFTVGTIILYVIHVTIQGVCYWWTMQKLQTMLFMDALEGYVGDALILSFVVSFFLPYSVKWMWIYIVIPMYLFYFIIRKIVDWVFTPDLTPENLEENKSNRQKKMEKRSLKQNVKSD